MELPQTDYYNIKVEKKVCAKDWDNLVRASVCGSFFALHEYFEAQKADVIFITAYDSANKLAGGIAGRIRASKFPANLIAKSVWVESGILTVSGNRAGGYIKKMMLEALEEEARRQKCVKIIFNHWCREDNCAVFVENGYEVLPNLTFITDLSVTEDELFSKLSKGHKSTVKKALKNKLHTEITNSPGKELIDRFYKLYVSTGERAVNNHSNASMLLKNKDFLERLFNNIELPCYLAAVHIDGGIAAAAILVEHQNTISYFIGASDLELNRQFGASNLLIWESILWAKQKGLRYFDYGGAPYNPSPENPAFGVYKFKKNFGGSRATFFMGQKIISAGKSVLLDAFVKRRSLVRLFLNLGI